MPRPPIVWPQRPTDSGRRGLLVAAGATSAFFVVLVGILFVWPIPRYLRLSPGPSPDVAAFISVEGAQAYEPESRLGMALVIVGEVDNLFELARASLDGDSEVFRREDLIAPDVSDEDNDRQNARLMTTSQDDATFVALDNLGYDVQASGQGALVTEVRAGTPAAGVLMVDDVITSIDGKPVSTIDDVVALVTSRPVGSESKVGFLRAGEVGEVGIITAPAPDDPTRPILGVSLKTDNPFFSLPSNLTVTIDAGDIGGPSAGLVYTLGIIDLLTPGDITGGHNIAATGEIRLDGTVGPVGGLAEKAIGVEKAGAQYFLVPAGDNFEEGQRAADGMRVVPVATLEEALAFLQDLRDGEELLRPLRG